MNAKTTTDSDGIACRFYSLGTMNSIRLYGCSERELLEDTVKRISEINDRMSAYQPESDISQINFHAGWKPAAISKETLRLLKTAKNFSAFTAGAFDITIRPLVTLWGINQKPQFIPEQQEISSALSLVNSDDLQLDEANGTAYLKKAGQAVDLGGIAKGYAADEAKRLLEESGVKSALINLGGNILTIGSRPDGTPWKIGVQNPAALRGEFLGMLSVQGQTVVTSGSNERFFVKDGVRYHHILDPHTGMPARSGLLSVTVVGADSMTADALSTAAFVLGMEKGIRLLKQMKAEAVFAAEDGRVYLTEGLIGQFEGSHLGHALNAGGLLK